MQTSKSFGTTPNTYPNYWIDGSNIDPKWSKIVTELGDNQDSTLRRGGFGAFQENPQDKKGVLRYSYQRRILHLWTGTKIQRTH